MLKVVVFSNMLLTVLKASLSLNSEEAQGSSGEVNKDVLICA